MGSITTILPSSPKQNLSKNDVKMRKSHSSAEFSQHARPGPLTTLLCTIIHSSLSAPSKQHEDIPHAHAEKKQKQNTPKKCRAKTKKQSRITNTHAHAHVHTPTRFRDLPLLTPIFGPNFLLFLQPLPPFSPFIFLFSLLSLLYVIQHIPPPPFLEKSLSSLLSLLCSAIFFSPPSIG